jgi:hypothetical protein
MPCRFDLFWRGMLPEPANHPIRDRPEFGQPMQTGRFGLVGTSADSGLKNTMSGEQGDNG